MSLSISESGESKKPWIDSYLKITVLNTSMYDMNHFMYVFFQGDFVLKSQQAHSIPITIHSNRPLGIIAPTSGYRTPPTNGRPLEAIRHSDSGDSVHGTERPFASVLNDKSLRTNASFYDTKYDNCSRSTNRPKYDTVTLILNRDKRILDFGFSISDRLYGTGVYVNKIRPHGPAELEGTLMPCMRIYKVCQQCLGKYFRYIFL